MLTKSQWGPKLWQFLHACSFAFPENPTPDETEAFQKLLQALRIILPCPMCRDHYCSFLETNPAPATCGSELQQWMVDFHNDVNKRTGKPTVNIDEARGIHHADDAKSQCAESQCNNKFWKIFAFVVTGLLALVLVIGFALTRTHAFRQVK